MGRADFAKGLGQSVTVEAPRPRTARAMDISVEFVLPTATLLNR